jgi:hypothetical protein
MNFNIENFLPFLSVNKQIFEKSLIVKCFFKFGGKLHNWALSRDRFRRDLGRRSVKLQLIYADIGVI